MTDIVTTQNDTIVTTVDDNISIVTAAAQGPTGPAGGGAGSGNTTYMQDLEPTNPNVGDTWYHNLSGVIKFYDGAVWQPIAIDGGTF